MEWRIDVWLTIKALTLAIDGSNSSTAYNHHSNGRTQFVAKACWALLCQDGRAGSTVRALSSSLYLCSVRAMAVPMRSAAASVSRSPTWA